MRLTTGVFIIALTSAGFFHIQATAPGAALKPDTVSAITASRISLWESDLASFPSLRLEEILAYQLGAGYVSNWREGTGLTVRGGGVDESQTLLDGMTRTNPLTNIPLPPHGRGMVEAVRVHKGGFTAGFGDIRSGLVQVVTKSGLRDRYSLSAEVAAGSAGKKHFGPHAYDRNGTIWETFAGPEAFSGIDHRMTYNEEHRDRYGRTYWTQFDGWDDYAVKYQSNSTRGDDHLTPQGALELWKWRHRPIEYGNKPDYMADFSIGGPVPGGFIPLLGRFLGKTTFFAAYNRERTMFPYPLTRDGYGKDSTFLKLTYTPTPATRIVASGLYMETTSVDSNYAGYANDRELGTRGRPDGTYWGMERAARYYVFEQMYNDSFHPQATDYNGSVRVELSHQASPRTSYQLSFNYQKWKTFQVHGPWRDTTKVKQIGGVWYDETPRDFAESTASGYDQAGIFALGDGARTSDYSSFKQLSYRIGIERRIKRSHTISFSAEHYDTEIEDRVKRIAGGPIWLSGSTIPGTNWQWWDGNPRRTNLFISDRIELPEVTAEIGFRLERLDTDTHTYELQQRFNRIYDYNRYNDSFPIRWPEMVLGETEPIWKVSPRLAVSFHPDEDWNIFFNYGHYYRTPNFRQLYATHANQAALGYPIQLANPTLDWPRTASYELGYNRLISDTYLFSLTGYYQDISNLPGMVSTYSYTKAIRIMNYVSRGYGDRRGFEVSMRKPRGEYLSGWVGYEYPVISSGVVGLDEYRQGIGPYIREVDGFMDNEETLLRQSLEDQPFARPTWKGLIDIHTPHYLGKFRGGWRAVLFHLKRAGGKEKIREFHHYGGDYHYSVMDRVPHYETRLRLEKRIGGGGAKSFTLYCIVDNPLNRKELFDVGGTETDRQMYLGSLKLPFEEEQFRGDDRWGDWDGEYIHLGFKEWYQFQHRRQFTFGARLNIN
ncbi:TonB-dependent receptor domain-containing protein [candidate division KSB1 bacterium]